MTDHFCPIDHIAIDAVDFDTALAFFKDVFGMTVTRFQGPEEAPTSLWLDGGVQLCRVEAQAADTGRGATLPSKPMTWTVCWTVPPATARRPSPASPGIGSGASESPSR